MKKADKTPKQQKDTSGLLLSVKKINKLKTRDSLSSSDGGGSGRSDTNDFTKSTQISH